MKAARPTVFWSARRRYWGAGAFCNAGISRKRARADSRAEDRCRRAATFAQEDQPLERSRRRVSFHYAWPPSVRAPLLRARRFRLWLSRRLTSFWQSRMITK